MNICTDFPHPAGQAAFASYLKPGETVRTPRMTYEAYTGGEDRARNLWRSFYLAHILPRENGDLRKKLHAIAHGPRQLHTLSLASRKGARCAIQRQIAKAKIEQAFRGVQECVADRFCHLAHIRRHLFCIRCYH